MDDPRPVPEPNGSWRDDPVVTRFWETCKRVPRYLALAGNMARDEEVPARAKAILAFGGIYALSPIDLVPGIIPVLGQVDDVVVLLVSIRSALALCPPRVAEDQLWKAGLADGSLPDDLAAVKGMVLWLGARGAAATGRGARSTRDWLQARLRRA